MAADYQFYEYKAFEYLIRLQQIFEGGEELSAVRDILQEIHEEEELLRSRKFRVAVVGEFRRGKSTFINALLGKEILPADVLPTTATLNRITYGAEPKACLNYKDGRKETVDIEELSRYVTKLTQESEKAASEILEAVVEYPSVFCQNHVDLIDTPGMNDDYAMNDLTLGQLEKIDLVIVTLSSNEPFSETEGEFMMKLLESEEICQIIVVVTKIDQIRKQEDRKRIVEHIEQRILSKMAEKIQERYAPEDPIYEKYNRIFGNLSVFGVSSLDALEARQYSDEELLKRSGFSELNSRLPELILVSQNNNAVLRASATIQHIAEDSEQIMRKIENECSGHYEKSKEERQIFARQIYQNVLDQKKHEEIQDVLNNIVKAFMDFQEQSVRKSFISCLSKIRVPDVYVIEKSLKEQALHIKDDINLQIKKDLIPLLRKTAAEECTIWFRELLGEAKRNPLVTETEREKIREMETDQELFSNIAAKSFNDICFEWKENPVPERSELAKRDFIVSINQNIQKALTASLSRNKARTEISLESMFHLAAEKTEEIVLAVYKDTDQKQEKWNLLKEKYTSKEISERLSQIKNDNAEMKKAFLQEVSPASVSEAEKEKI